ncbi:glycerophosphodiester phosphodiesterase [Streptomyces sp. A3M-1-3]|uniref:glycerophosphodiester phosphodiesterase n=1 Tax=Streptomyces sp. A3M-1-3 TaxID=2962044 RepID=UPI0020B7FAB0|nr:glycerophosphodiester phosphodiesterase family protein [Streptomyces sp. A3M-1-3]MCP3820959.1 glycerophosphodiester phosphodiesterase [Streptomyces sp. A3M-1-3]
MYLRPAAAAAAALLGATALVAPAAPSAARARESLCQHCPVVFAHRGASAYAPENTLAAIDLADRMGFEWVENDVQRTKDGRLVVMHDDNLVRTTNAEEVFPGRAPWKVKDFTAAEIARLDAGSWFDQKFAGARVPTLEQYVNRLSHNEQRLLLEIKKPELYPGIEQDTLRVLDEAGWLDAVHVNERLVIQSFGVESLRSVHQQRPEVTTGFLGTPPVADLAAYAAFTDRINPSHTTITSGYVAAIHALNGAHGRPLEVNTWTVDDAAGAVRARDLGVDGIITNNPDVVGEAVCEG